MPQLDTHFGRTVSRIGIRVTSHANVRDLLTYSTNEDDGSAFKQIPDVSFDCLVFGLAFTRRYFVRVKMPEAAFKP